MRYCYAVQLIRHFNSLPERDERGRIRKAWHWIRRKSWPTQEGFWLDNPPYGNHRQLLNRAIIENRGNWSQKDLGYE